MNLTQATFENWSQGGENTLAYQINLNSNFTLDEEKYNWANNGKFSFGQAKIGDAETKKSADEIKLETVLTYKLNLFINPFAAISAQTQFTKGYKYDKDTKTEISNFLDPGYFVLSAGVGHSQGDEFKTRLGGALKITSTKTFTSFSDNPETLDKVEKTKTEGGISSVTEYKKTLEENILFSSKLEFFSNLKQLKQVDIRWDNMISAKVSKYISVGLNIELFYDFDLSTKRQLKEALSLGLTYSFL